LNISTTSEIHASAARPSRAGRPWLRRLLTTLSVIAVAIAFPVVCGALVPGIPLVGILGTVFESFLSLHLVLLALTALILSLVARKLGGGRLVTVTAALSLISLIGSVVPVVALLRTAHRYGARISWLQHLHVTAVGPRAEPTETDRYARLDGHDLFLDVYLPDQHRFAPPWPRVFMIHGGGFTVGDRSQGRNWDRWLAQRGYAVFDVDYRLAPPASWNLAAQDVACAMSWVQSRPERYRLRADRALIVGQSAGASLALQVAYGLGDGAVVSSCGGPTPPQPTAVVAFYPAENLGLLWTEDTRIGPLDSRDVDLAYLGGSPAQFPARYEATNVIDHVRPGVPPTLVLYGEHDHLIPIAGHLKLAAKLTAAGVYDQLAAIPYGEHGYDIFWGSLGGQISRRVVADFLQRCYPAGTAGQEAAR
jgi:acetyl esterase